MNILLTTWDLGGLETSQTGVISPVGETMTTLFETSSFNLPKPTQTKNKPNKVSQKKRRLKRRQKGK